MFVRPLPSLFFRPNISPSIGDPVAEVPGGIDPASFENLTPEQLAAYVQDGTLPTAAPPATATDPAAVAEAPEGEPPATETPPAAEAAPRTGNPDVPLRQVREENRQLQAQLQQQGAQLQQLMGYVQAITQQGQGAAQQQPAAPPNPFDDPEGYTNHVVNQAVGPLQAQIRQQQDFIAQLHRQNEIAQLTHQYGPETPAMIQQFDAAAPELRGLPSELKVLVGHGLRSVSPATQAAQAQATQAQATQLATQQVQAALERAPKGAPPTLGKAPVAKPAASPAPDIANMTPEDFAKMSPADMAKMAQYF